MCGRQHEKVCIGVRQEFLLREGVYGRDADRVRTRNMIQGRPPSWETFASGGGNILLERVGVVTKWLGGVVNSRAGSALSHPCGQRDDQTYLFYLHLISLVVPQHQCGAVYRRAGSPPPGRCRL